MINWEYLLLILNKTLYLTKNDLPTLEVPMHAVTILQEVYVAGRYCSVDSTRYLSALVIPRRVNPTASIDSSGNDEGGERPGRV